MNAPVSIREVAAHAGVSVGTVSNVLNRPDIVARSTRDRVQEAIKALGFVRNEWARQLRAAAAGSSAWSCWTWRTHSSPMWPAAWKMRRACPGSPYPVHDPTSPLGDVSGPIWRSRPRCSASCSAASTSSPAPAVSWRSRPATRRRLRPACLQARAGSAHCCSTPPAWTPPSLRPRRAPREASPRCGDCSRWRRGQASPDRAGAGSRQHHGLSAALGFTRCSGAVVMAVA